MEPAVSWTDPEHQAAFESTLVTMASSLRGLTTILHQSVAMCVKDGRLAGARRDQLIATSITVVQVCEALLEVERMLAAAVGPTEARLRLMGATPPLGRAGER